MRIYNLQFATIVPVQENIAEVIFRRDIEIDIAMVETIHEFLRDHFTAPIAVLINKKYPYTLSFAAQQSICNIPEIHAIAILVYSTLSKNLSLNMLNQPRQKPLNAKVISNREDAEIWLKSQLLLKGKIVAKDETVLSQGIPCP